MATANPPSEPEVVQKLSFQAVKGLPPGWRREVVVRKNGLSAGKTDVYYYSPCGKKFRSKPQIARFLGDSADLTCFDFSRAGSPGDGTQRRRARDRTTARRTELLRAMPLVRPLTNNPLRPSGPIRRTCGVIKLPVTWVAPPSDDEMKSNLTTTNDPKQQSPINVIVQSLWEKRLFGVRPYDHMTGSEITAKIQNGIVDTSDLIKTAQLTPIRKPQSPRTTSPTQSLLMSPSVKSPPPLMSPTLMKHHHSLYRPLPASDGTTHTPLQPISTSQNTPRQHLGANIPGSLQLNGQQGHLAGRDVIYLSLQQKPQGQQQAAQLPNGPSQPQQVPLLVTDSELRIQEERVRLLRQQLMAAEGTA